MTWPDDRTTPETPPLTLHPLKFAVHRPIPESVRQTAQMEQMYDTVRDSLVLKMSATVMAEQLPDQTLRGEVTAPRWATWWDHLKDTYRDRWWFAWVVRRWPVRYIDVPHQVHVPLQSWWTYPDTPHLYHSGMGYSVLRVQPTPPEWGCPP